MLGLKEMMLWIGKKIKWRKFLARIESGAENTVSALERSMTKPYIYLCNKLLLGVHYS